MTSIGRMYETEEKAQDAARRLREDGFLANTIAVVAPGSRAGAIPRSVPRDQAIAYSRALAAGQWLVVVEAPFNWGQVATGHLLDAGPVSTAGVPSVRPRNPSPFSDFIGFPTLSTRGRSYLSRIFPELASPHFAFSSMLGMKMVSSSRGPYRPVIPFPVLSRSSGPYRPVVPFPLLTRSRGSYKPIIPLPLLTKRQR
jgi:hypothetical protein